LTEKGSRLYSNLSQKNKGAYTITYTKMILKKHKRGNWQTRGDQKLLDGGPEDERRSAIHLASNKSRKEEKDAPSKIGIAAACDPRATRGCISIIHGRRGERGMHTN
jgi:hypothetical protein